MPSGEDTKVVREEPLLLKIGQEELVTMRTPGHDRELAIGFLVSERILSDPSLIESITPFKKGPIQGLDIKLPEGIQGRGGRLSRVHEIRASCGLCGIPSVENIAADLAALSPALPRYSLKQLASSTELMRAQQPLFHETGGSHAAALLHDGELHFVREDVGRHNAVDKVLGAALEQGHPFSESALVLSGRAGFELIMKGLRLGIPIFISVSAPTSFSIELAEESGATLIAFARNGHGTVFCDDHRIIELGESADA